jgi:hypothetical protein
MDVFVESRINSRIEISPCQKTKQIRELAPNSTCSPLNQEYIQPPTHQKSDVEYKRNFKELFFKMGVFVESLC